MKICMTDDCEKQVIARRLCPTHYAAARRAGQFAVRQLRPRQPLMDRLLKNIDQSGGPEACWPWRPPTRYRRGYGMTYIFVGDKRVTTSAHRAMYIATHGSIPDDLQVLHSCQNPPCCNPAHLRAGTPAENCVDRHIDGLNNPNGNWSPRFVPVSEETTEAIRAAYRPRTKGRTIRAVAGQFGLDQAMVWQIVNHKGRWAESA